MSQQTLPQNVPTADEMRKNPTEENKKKLKQLVSSLGCDAFSSESDVTTGWITPERAKVLESTPSPFSANSDKVTESHIALPPIAVIAELQLLGYEVVKMTVPGWFRFVARWGPRPR